LTFLALEPISAATTQFGWTAAPERSASIRGRAGSIFTLLFTRLADAPIDSRLAPAWGRGHADAAASPPTPLALT